MTTFALVHGGWHGAWCWERLIPELEARGHRTVAMDLPCEDPSATFGDYAAVVAAALEPEQEDMIVVGHSTGGLTIPLVAARRPVRRLIYLCALVPTPGLSYFQQLGAEPDTLVAEPADMGEVDEEGRITLTNESAVREALFADCPEADVRWAFERLRPQAGHPYSVPCPLEELPEAPSTYVVCQEDRMVNPERGRAIADGRLGAEVVELPGSHSPFLSRPAKLAEVLHQLAPR